MGCGTRGLQKSSVLLLMAFSIFSRYACAQDPSLFLTLQGLQQRAEIAKHEPWARADLAALIREADAFPQSYEQRFGLASVELPPEGGQWLHWYVCPDTGTPLTFRPPNHNVCPDTGKEYPGRPLDQAVYQLRNDDLRKAALTLALAYRFRHEGRYAKQAADILKAYADQYKLWPLHDNNGKASPNGARAYSQTLDESIWLIDIAWTYDLIRGAGLFNDKTKAHIENDLLRASYETVSKAHKEPTDNIQSWINAAIAAVGYTLHDQALIHEAIDGPIGFRYQMHHFVQEGFWIEGAFGYHFYALRALVATAQMAQAAGLNLWQEEPALLSLFTGPIGLVLPNGELPVFNDSNRTSLFAQDYLYEQAYAASKNPELLPVVTELGRTNREALLFGVEHLPAPKPWKLGSKVFVEAGYAALRNDENDLTVITKFGGHGGGHGHYDKLNFVLYSQGRVMGIDPGTQLYGLPLHKEWDSMTIAHNTISVDETRQAAATGKLISWQTNPDWTAITMDAGSVYSGMTLQRTIVLTPQYCVLLDHVDSSSSVSHTVDWIYHDRGVLTLEQPTAAVQATGLSTQNGYAHLEHVLKYVSSDPFRARFVDPPAASEGEDNNPNSPAATTRSSGAHQNEEMKGTRSAATIELTMPADGEREVFSGVAPGHDLKKPVPFVLVRKRGSDVRFLSVLSPVENLHVQWEGIGAQRTVKISGSDFSDTVSSGSKVDVQHVRTTAPR